MKMPKSIADMLTQSSSTSVDAFTILADHPLRAEHQAISHFLEEVRDSIHGWEKIDYHRLASWQAIQQSTPHEQVRILLAHAERVAAYHQPTPQVLAHRQRQPLPHFWHLTAAIKALAVQLLRRQLPFTGTEMSALIARLLEVPKTTWPRTIPWQNTFPLGSLIRQVEWTVEAQGLTPELERTLYKLRAALNEHYADECQVESLDEVIELREDPHVAFLKLVPLVGG